ncbi:MAG: MarR family winged helix-turn-helix transcriptional regulator [Acidothermaceae bacterium]
MDAAKSDDQAHGADLADPVNPANPVGRIDAAGAIAAAIEQLAMWVRRNAPSQLSTSTVTTLDTLASKGPLRISQLADHEAISQPGMTTLVNRLEAAGHAERVADPTDGRAALVRITDAGREVLAQRHVARTTALRTELRQLDTADIAALAAALPAIQRLADTDITPSTPQQPPPAQSKPSPEHQQPHEHRQHRPAQPRPSREHQQPQEKQPQEPKRQQQAGPRR